MTDQPPPSRQVDPSLPTSEEAAALVTWPSRIALIETTDQRPGWRFFESTHPCTWPTGPWPGVFRPGSFLSLRCWLDEDGIHVWQAHDCNEGHRSVGMLPHPTWQAIDGGRVEPSIDCDGCGLHTFWAINCRLAKPAANDGSHAHG
jgi:hypothetical protein